MLIPLNKIIGLKKIRGIIHVGAHDLEELPSYLKAKISKVIWIEANPEKYEYIQNKIKIHKKMVLGKFAAGNKVETLKLNISNNGQSSSLLELGTHSKNYPKIKYVSEVDVKVMPIDKWLNKKSINHKAFNFVNIDIQGYELEALKGMQNHLKNVEFAYLEVNFDQVYKNCAELNDVDNFLNKFNLKRVGIFRTNKGWGDAIYVRENVLFNRIYYLIIIPQIRFFRIIKKVKNKFIISIRNLFSF